MITIEELREQHDSLTYFNDDLSVKGEMDWEAIYNNPEAMLTVVNDTIYVNRMNSIAREKEWKAFYLAEGRPYHATLMKQRLTSPSTEANEFGEVIGWGSKMDPEMWDVYEKHYDELFETHYLEQNDKTS